MNITPERARKIAVIINNFFWALWAFVVIASWVWWPMLAVVVITILFVRDMFKLIPRNNEE